MLYDISFPLRYEKGGIKSESKSMEMLYSQVRHFLNTIAGERLLQPNFGVRIEILYESTYPEIFEAQLDLGLRQVIPNDVGFEVTTESIEDGKLAIAINFLSKEEIDKKIRESLIQIYATGT